LTVHYKGDHISEVLDMPIEEAGSSFEPIKAIPTGTCVTAGRCGSATFGWGSRRPPCPAVRPRG